MQQRGLDPETELLFELASSAGAQALLALLTGFHQAGRELPEIAKGLTLRDWTDFHGTKRNRRPERGAEVDMQDAVAIAEMGSDYDGVQGGALDPVVSKWLAPRAAVGSGAQHAVPNAQEALSRRLVFDDLEEHVGQGWQARRHGAECTLGGANCAKVALRRRVC